MDLFLTTVKWCQNLLFSMRPLKGKITILLGCTVVALMDHIPASCQKQWGLPRHSASSSVHHWVSKPWGQWSHPSLLFLEESTEHVSRHRFKPAIWVASREIDLESDHPETVGPCSKHTSKHTHTLHTMLSYLPSLQGQLSREVGVHFRLRKSEGQ